LRNRLQESIQNQLYDIEVIESKVVNVAVWQACTKPSQWWECLEVDRTLFDLGKKLKAKALVVGKLAALGESKRFRLRVADSFSQTISTGVVQMNQDDYGPIISQCLLFVEKIIAQPQQQPSESWYTKWEVWAVAGTVLALVVGGALILSLPESGGPIEDWDHRLLLP